MFDPYENLFGNHFNRKFCDIFPEVDTFIKEYEESAFFKYSTVNLVYDQDLVLIYYLLYARYGNSTIASFDENQFRYKLFSIIFTQAPTWRKELEIQENLRELSDKDLITGAKRIYNKSYNPSVQPTTQTLEELETINEQHVDGWKKSKLEGYANLMMLLKTDVTEKFVNRFSKLFIKVAQPNYPLWYITEEKETDND